MIELDGLSTSAPGFALRDITLTVPTGQYAVLMGRTGCGKTTILECICGLRRVERGRIRIGGDDVTDWSPAARGIGYVPQDLALVPTLTVGDHLRFAPRVRGWASADIQRRTVELAQLLGIAHLIDRRIDGLSGGEAQRTALGRALAFHPRILLLDEPLAALDEATRDEMIQLLRTLRDTAGVTTLHVTHHRGEATALAHVRFELVAGAIQTSS